MIQNLILYIGIYLLGPFVLTLSLKLLKKFIMNEIQKQFRRKRKEIVYKQSFWSKTKEAITFILRHDKRKTKGVTNKGIIISLYLIGLIGFVLLNIINQYVIAYIFFFIPYIDSILAQILFSPIKNSRMKFLEKAYSLKRDRMGFVENQRGEQIDYSVELEVLDWGEDNISPQKLRINIPTRFDMMGESGFLEQWNQFFGQAAKWAPDRSDPKDPGWNYEAGHVTIVKMPPLPTLANWDEKYVLDENIAWSFFPIALGVENGVKLFNKETGKDEFVLGFDVAGEQRKKKGIQMGKEVILAPHVLISGATGGGKALSVDTVVPLIKNNTLE